MEIEEEDNVCHRKSRGLPKIVPLGGKKCIRCKNVIAESSKMYNMKLFCSKKCRSNEKGRKLSGKFKDYKRGAIKRNHEFLLTKEDFQKFVNVPCNYCNDYLIEVGIDRVDNRKGYTMKNCVPCCKICNVMKKELEVGFFLEQCKKITSTAKV